MILAKSPFSLGIEFCDYLHTYHMREMKLGEARRAPASLRKKLTPIQKRPIYLRIIGNSRTKRQKIFRLSASQLGSKTLAVLSDTAFEAIE